MKTLRTTHRGKDRVMGGMRYMVRRNNGDPACWRPAWGGVRLCGNDWWVRLIFGEWCRFAQDDTVGEAERST